MLVLANIWTVVEKTGNRALVDTDASMAAVTQPRSKDRQAWDCSLAECLHQTLG